MGPGTGDINPLTSINRGRWSVSRLQRERIATRISNAEYITWARPRDHRAQPASQPASQLALAEERDQEANTAEEKTVACARTGENGREEQEEDEVDETELVEQAQSVEEEEEEDASRLRNRCGNAVARDSTDVTCLSTRSPCRRASSAHTPVHHYFPPRSPILITSDYRRRFWPGSRR